LFSSVPAVQAYPKITPALNTVEESCYAQPTKFICGA
jgi:hypothetical protein